MKKPFDLHFVKVGNGRIALNHKPRGVHFHQMRGWGCTHVVTLLKESEGAEHIGSMAKNAGLDWMWLPVPDGNHPEGGVHRLLVGAMPRLSQLLDEGASLFIHCSAGIHRTGTVTYGLLRWRGLSRAKSLKLIAQMRTITSEGMGEKRLRWGDEIARDLPRKKTSWIPAIKEFIAQFRLSVFKRR